MADRKIRKTHQVWALLPNDNGGQSWRPVTRRYETEAAAVKIAGNLWLDTRIEEQDVDPEDQD